MIDAPANEVFAALTTPDLITKWSKTEASMGQHKGDSFKLFNGHIYGNNLEVKRNQLLVQEWYADDWPRPSKVTLTLHEKVGKTELTLVHNGVPTEDVEKITLGWKTRYLGAIQQMYSQRSSGE